MKDSFNTIETATFGEFKDKGSKFLAYAAPLGCFVPRNDGEADFSVFLEKIKNTPKHGIIALHGDSDSTKIATAQTTTASLAERRDDRF
jgi:hypothetical protein